MDYLTCRDLERPVGLRDSGVTGPESNGTRMQNAGRIRAGSELSHVISTDL